MWLKRFFIETPIDFERKCKNRIMISIFGVILGIISIILSFKMFHLGTEQQGFVSGYYMGVGGGLLGASIATLIKNIRYLKIPEVRKKREIIESDERNRMLGLRCWAYAGYGMFLFLYIGILVSGFISLIVLKTLLAVLAMYGILLLFFLMLLGKAM